MVRLLLLSVLVAVLFWCLYGIMYLFSVVWVGSFVMLLWIGWCLVVVIAC